MKINFKTNTIKPMYEWLLEYKTTGKRDEKQLRNILNMDDYKIEFLRYSLKNLPVCNISYEEAVDFFMNFDTKKFVNERLNYKQNYFLNFYNNIDTYKDLIKMYSSINEEDIKVINDLLKNGLPENLINKVNDYNIILIISIGNSMGWPYENYIDFDVANLNFFKDKNTFLHIIAHEIHHTMFYDLMPKEYTANELFLLNFAFEGLAVHFNNNAHTKYKQSKYNYEMIGINTNDWKLYDDEFESLFSRFRNDLRDAASMTEDKVVKLISDQYEKFTYKNKLGKKVKIEQYPTYYLGCHFFGMIDLVYGKEELYKSIKNPFKLIDLYNKAVEIKYQDEKTRNKLLI